MSGIADVIAKIRKLRALSRSTSVHEAAAAAAAADRLIQEHRIAEAEIVDATTTTARIEADPIIIEEGNRRTLWRWQLAIVIANHYGCACVTGRGEIEGRPVRFLQVCGRPDDVAIVREVFPWVQGEIARLGSEAKTKAEAVTSLEGVDAATRAAALRVRARYGLPTGEPFDGRAFGIGAVTGFAEALAASTAEVMRAASTSTTLVLAGRVDEASTALQAEGVTKTAPARTVPVDADSMSYAQGVIAGAAIAVDGARRRRLVQGE